MEFACHLFGVDIPALGKAYSDIQYAAELRSKSFILLKDAMHIIRGTLRLISSCRWKLPLWSSQWHWSCKRFVSKVSCGFARAVANEPSVRVQSACCRAKDSTVIKMNNANLGCWHELPSARNDLLVIYLYTVVKGDGMQRSAANRWTREFGDGKRRQMWLWGSGINHNKAITFFQT